MLPETEPTDPINRRIELVVLLPEIAEAIRNPAIMGPGASLPDDAAEALIELPQQDEPQAQDPE